MRGFVSCKKCNLQHQKLYYIILYYNCHNNFLELTFLQIMHFTCLGYKVFAKFQFELAKHTSQNGRKSEKQS